ncbi:MAG TPA: YggT family protein [Vicinamibacteria bacterium]|nr:YggT family protein [Vicinamibacteria bacterium]
MNGNVLGQLIDLYTVVVFVAVIISWLQLPPYNPIVRYTRMLTEPLLAPIRRILPPVAGLDFSPLILLILLRMVRGII